MHRPAYVDGIDPSRLIITLQTSVDTSTSRSTSVPPIDRLPEELLSPIFEYCLDGGTYHSDRIFRTITVSHVCRSWRNIMLNTAALWNLIDLRYLTIGRHFCVRSRASGIYITFVQTLFTEVHALLSYAVETLSPHLHRLAGIHLSAHPKTIRAIICRLCAAFPELLLLVSGLEPRIGTGSTLLVELDSTRVHRVSSEGVSLIGSNNPSIFPTRLTRLALAHLHPDACPSVGQVLSILHRCSSLEEIVLISALSPNLGSTEGTQFAVRVVDLPHLRSLEIADESKPCIADLLSNLSTPATTSLFIHCHGVSDLSTVLPNNLSRLRMFSSQEQGDARKITKLQITSNRITLISQAASRCLSSVHFAVCPEDLPRILANLPSLRSIISHVIVLQAAIQHQNTSVSSITRGVWENALICMPLLTTLEMGGVWTEGILSALCAGIETIFTLPASSMTPERGLRCKGLRSLRVADRSGDDHEGAVRQMESVEHCLATRAQSLGATLNSLSIEVLNDSTRVAVTSFLGRLEHVSTEVVVCEGGLTSVPSDLQCEPSRAAPIPQALGLSR